MANSTLIEDYLDGRGGSSSFYRLCLSKGNRIGQSFFNSLSADDARKLRGTHLDPFHSNDQESVYKAMEFLLDKE